MPKLHEGQCLTGSDLKNNFSGMQANILFRIYFCRYFLFLARNVDFSIFDYHVMAYFKNKTIGETSKLILEIHFTETCL